MPKKFLDGRARSPEEKEKLKTIVAMLMAGSVDASDQSSLLVSASEDEDIPVDISLDAEIEDALEENSPLVVALALMASVPTAADDYWEEILLALDYQMTLDDYERDYLLLRRICCLVHVYDHEVLRAPIDMRSVQLEGMLQPATVLLSCFLFGKAGYWDPFLYAVLRLTQGGAWYSTVNPIEVHTAVSAGQPMVVPWVLSEFILGDEYEDFVHANFPDWAEEQHSSAQMLAAGAPSQTVTTTGEVVGGPPRGSSGFSWRWVLAIVLSLLGGGLIAAWIISSSQGSVTPTRQPDFLQQPVEEVEARDSDVEEVSEGE